MSATPKYKTANAFRVALEARLLNMAKTRGEAWLVRRRKFMVFDRLLARLIIASPDRWLLKGAVALDFRLGERARATMDLDLYRHGQEAAAMADLIAIQSLDLGDYFSFQIARTNKLDDLLDAVAVRYRVTANLDARRFESVTVDIGFDQHLGLSPVLLDGPDFFAFAGIPPIEIPTIPLEQHVAEKIHAYTRIYGDGRQSTRVKDLIDLVLIAENAAFDAGLLRQAIEGTFATRTPQAIPSALPLPPDDWAAPYRVLATDTGLDPDIATGHAIASRFLNPILSGVIQANARWDPAPASGSRLWRMQIC